MYSQHSSENPIRTNPIKFFDKFPKLISRLQFSINSNYLKELAKPIKSVFATVTAVILFVGAAMGAYCIEGLVNVGFKPDFQSNQPSYSSRNVLFDKNKDTVQIKLIIHGDKVIELISPIVTVGDIIEEYSITLGADDVINFSDDEEIFEGMEICIDEVKTQTYTQSVVIPYTTTTNKSQTVPKGTTKILQKGVNGTATETVTETYVNGKLADTKVLTDSENSIAPVEEIVEVGVGGKYTDKNGVTYEYSYYLDVTATAYGTCSGITATGKAVDFGMIAVDPSVIPLGTKVYLTGSTYGDMGVHTAEDTGGAIKGNKIDVFLGDDYNTLMQFGRRTMRIYILA